MANLFGQIPSGTSGLQTSGQLQREYGDYASDHMPGGYNNASWDNYVNQQNQLASNAGLRPYVQSMGDYLSTSPWVTSMNQMNTLYGDMNNLYNQMQTYGDSLISAREALGIAQSGSPASLPTAQTGGFTPMSSYGGWGQPTGTGILAAPGWVGQGAMTGGLLGGGLHRGGSQ
jgi:hypothetical protein